MKILYANAQSIQGKMNELGVVASDLKPDIILITESWCHSEITNSFLDLPGFELNGDLRTDRCDTHHGIGGGLLVYSSPEVKILPRDKNGQDDLFNQFCSFDIMTEGDTLTIVLVYRSPNSTAENNERLLKLVQDSPTNVILVGDFNFPGIDWKAETASSKTGRSFLDACRERGFDQMVAEPTHIKGNILDLVLTDKVDGIISVETGGRLGRSDHEILLVEVEVKRNQTDSQRKTPNWGRADWDSMRAAMGEVEWEREMKDMTADQAWVALKNKITQLVEDYVPQRVMRTAGRPPWMSTELLRSIRKKRRLWKNFKRSPTAENKEIYAKEEKRVHKEIRKAKKKTEQNLAGDKENQKKFYKYLKGKTRSRTGVGPLVEEGRKITDDMETADVLNRYFGSVFQQEDCSNIPKPTGIPVKSKCTGSNFRPSLVKQKIRKLKTNSAPGPDGITPRMLKELVEEVAGPLSIIFTKSLREKCVPEDWRIANVTAIFKKGQKSKSENYRPVSLTSVPGKLMESILKDTMLSHLQRNKLIRQTQHGFMASKSCTTNLLTFLEVATRAVDEGRSLDVIYLDFAKAFDLVPRSRLIAKMKAHGFGGELLEWVEAWLTDRKQCVVVNGKKSQWVPVTSGVPQGSILGPILFTIFINDLDEEVENLVSLLLKFADDTKVGKVVEDEEDRAALQAALDKLCSWADKWGMRFNQGKCKVLHIGRNNPQFEYSMNGARLDTTDEEKDIGVMITNNLKPGRQCEQAAGKAMSVLGQVLRAFSYRDKTVLPRIYKQYIRPHLEFAVQAWAPWNRGDIEKLEMVQKKMVKNVTGLKGKTYEERMVELEMESLEDRRKKLDLIQTYKIVREVDNVNPDTWFKLIQNDRQQRTRGTEGGLTIRRETSKLEIRHNFYSQRAAEQWNTLPLDLRNIEKVQEFRNRVKKL